MRDFLPSDVRKRNYVINIIKEVYESYGFEPLETPSVENLETLTGKYGEEGNQLIFKILKRGEKLQEQLSAGAIKNENELSDLALRYDLTVPLARVVANHKNDLPKFFKRYQIQPVWRADRPARGRFREFYQCDVDAIGSSSMIVEAELCAAVSEILIRLGFDSFAIQLNHREILTAVLEASGIPSNKHIDALVALDKIDKIGIEKFRDELVERGIEEDSINKFARFMVDYYAKTERLLNTPINDIDELIKSKEGNLQLISDIERRKFLNENVLKIIGDFVSENKCELKGIKQLKEIIKGSNYSQHIFVDVALARGLSYYTGAVMEIRVPDLAGSLGGGGRYDGLIGMFGKEQIPACGFSLGLERILVVMEECGMFPPELADASADVMVTIWNENSIGEALKLAAELRKDGLRVLVYPEADKLGKQFKYADSIKVPFVCVLGETELAENKVTLKNLLTGGQESVERGKVAENIKL